MDMVLIAYGCKATHYLKKLQDTEIETSTPQRWHVRFCMCVNPGQLHLMEEGGQEA
jgi:hypothetical protein